MQDSRRSIGPCWRVLIVSLLAVTGAGVRTAVADDTPRAALDRYCVTCHNQRLKTAGLTLDTLDLTALSAHTDVGEAVVRKLRGGLMPPAGSPRPDRDTYASMRSWFEKELDRIAATSTNPGSTESF